MYNACVLFRAAGTFRTYFHPPASINVGLSSQMHCLVHTIQSGAKYEDSKICKSKRCTTNNIVWQNQSEDSTQDLSNQRTA